MSAVRYLVRRTSCLRGSRAVVYASSVIRAGIIGGGPRTETPIDLDDLTPAGGGSLRLPVTGPNGHVVAQFTPTRPAHPAQIWPPFTRMNDMTRGGSQGNPFGGYRPGRSIEHEPVDRSERMPMDTAQNVAAHDDDEEDDRQQPVVFSHAQAGRDIRAALRGT